jgi:hypothetical protein
MLSAVSTLLCNISQAKKIAFVFLKGLPNSRGMEIYHRPNKLTLISSSHREFFICSPLLVDLVLLIIKLDIRECHEKKSKFLKMSGGAYVLEVFNPIVVF